jgi:hypothetical protein
MNNNERKVCRICGEVIEDGFAVEVESGIYCESCAMDNLAWCDHCETWHDEDMMQSVTVHVGFRRIVESWCAGCVEQDAAECFECGDLYEEGALVEVRGGHCVCPQCIDSEYYYCDECGEYVPASEWNADEDACFDCAPALIVRYHGADSAFPRFYASDDERLGLFSGIGFEIEVDRNDHNAAAEAACVRDLHDLLGERAVFERDGSLHNGFEIVTRPHTLRAFREQFPLEEVLRICRAHGYSAHDIGSCGFHMHVSRAYFGNNQTAQERAIGKCLAFYDIFFEDMVKASRRTLDRARQWANRVPVADMRDARKKAKAGSWDIGRYSAVNTTNAHTVEFRLMRGTLNADSLRACIDILLAVARNAKRCSWDTATTSPAEMLRGLKPASIDYLRRREAFVNCLDDIITARGDEEVK